MEYIRLNRGTLTEKHRRETNIKNVGNGGNNWPSSLRCGSV